MSLVSTVFRGYVMKWLFIICSMFLTLNLVKAQSTPFPTREHTPVRENTTVEGEISESNPLASYEFVAPRAGWMVFYFGTDFEARRQEQSIAGPSCGGGAGNGIFDNRVETHLAYIYEGDIYRVAISSLDGEFGRYTLRYEYLDLQSMPVLPYDQSIQGSVNSQQLFQIYTVSTSLGDALQIESDERISVLFMPVAPNPIYPTLSWSYPIYLQHSENPSSDPFFVTGESGTYALVVWAKTLNDAAPFTLTIEQVEGTLAERPQFVRLTPNVPEQTLIFTPPSSGAYNVHARFLTTQAEASFDLRQNGLGLLELTGAAPYSAPVDVAGYFPLSSTDPVELTITGSEFGMLPGRKQVIDLIVALNTCETMACS